MPRPSNGKRLLSRRRLVRRKRYPPRETSPSLHVIDVSVQPPKSVCLALSLSSRQGRCVGADAVNSKDTDRRMRFDRESLRNPIKKDFLRNEFCSSQKYSAQGMIRVNKEEELSCCRSSSSLFWPISCKQLTYQQNVVPSKTVVVTFRQT